MRRAEKKGTLRARPAAGAARRSASGRAGEIKRTAAAPRKGRSTRADIERRKDRWIRHYIAKFGERFSLQEFDWAWAVYLAKRGDLSELLLALRDDTHSAPTPRTRIFISSLLEHRGKYSRRRGIGIRGVELARIRSLFRFMQKAGDKKTWIYHVMAKYYGVAESTLRDAIAGKRDFAGK